MFWLIPAVCGLLAVIAIVTGALPVLIGLRDLQERVRRLESKAALADPARLQAAMERLRRDADDVTPLLERAASALRQIVEGIRSMRMTEALAALRVAGVAVRALLALR